MLPNVIRLAVVVILTSSVTGCAFHMARTRSSYRDTGVLKVGAERSAVIRELGPPDASHILEKGGHVDLYRIDPRAHRDGIRRFASVSHLILDIASFGLWEFVGTPLELAARDRLVTFLLTYDPLGNLAEMETVSDWQLPRVSEADRKACHERASADAAEVRMPDVAGRALRQDGVVGFPFTAPLHAVEAGFDVKEKRATVYQRAMAACLLPTYAKGGR